MENFLDRKIEITKENYDLYKDLFKIIVQEDENPKYGKLEEKLFFGVTIISIVGTATAIALINVPIILSTLVVAYLSMYEGSKLIEKSKLSKIKKQLIKNHSNANINELDVEYFSNRLYQLKMVIKNYDEKVEKEKYIAKCEKIKEELARDYRNVDFSYFANDVIEPKSKVKVKKYNKL